MSPTLEIYISIFLSVTGVLLIIIGVFLIKLILELSKLANNLNDIMTIIRSDLEPMIKELQTALTSINSFVQETDKKVSAFKGIASKLLGAGSIAFSGIQGLTGSFWKGMSAGMNLFKNRK